MRSFAHDIKLNGTTAIIIFYYQFFLFILLADIAQLGEQIFL